MRCVHPLEGEEGEGSQGARDPEGEDEKGEMNVEGDGGEGCDSVNTSSACTLFCCN